MPLTSRYQRTGRAAVIVAVPALYNSIFRYDDQMLVNQYIYGTYGYIAPILPLRRVEGADLFDTYMRSFEMVWEQSYPYEPDKRLSA